MVNIFILDKDLKKSARYTLDCHVSRGIFEAAMIFFTVRNLLNIEEKGRHYRPSHKYHGIIKWVRYSSKNYEFLYEFTKYLNDEYKSRYKKDVDHVSFELMRETYKDFDEICELFEIHEFTSPYQAMPLVFRCSDDMYVEAYRKYYFFHKRFSLPFVTWKNREKPDWFNYEYFIENNLIPSDYVEVIEEIKKQYNLQ